MTETKNIYVLYAASDSAALRFIDRLKAFEKRYKITIWDDDPIQQNLVWRPQETTRLERADLFVLLLSKNFMYSEFVQQLEFKQVIDRYKVGASKIVPVVLDDCPWDTNFESDDYNFSFKELQVLPEGGKPLTQWDSEDEALKIVLPKVEEAISSIAQPIEEKKPLQEQKKEAAGIPLKDQLALDFEKQAEAKRQAEEEKRIREAEIKKKETEEKLQREAEVRQKAAEQKKLQKAAEERRIAEEERLRQEAEEKRKREAESVQKEAAAKKQALEERLRNEAEQRIRVEEEHSAITSERASDSVSKDHDEVEAEPKDDQNSRKKILIGSLIAALSIMAIVFFSRSGEDTEEGTSPGIVSDTLDVEDSINPEQSESKDPAAEESLPELAIGDTYDGGIIFTIDPSGRTGKIAHHEDAGPMPWQDAMIIHDQLGPGWRLPSLEELQTMYRNIGPGADNSGEFANGLYWSSTDYDEYQARLLRFRDGNTSYHYNKEVESRRFLVRAVRDFVR